MPKLTAKEEKLFRDTHGGFAGRSLIERIETLMDKQRKKAEKLAESTTFGTADHSIVVGRVDGLAAALAILRSSSVREEISRSNERLGIE